MRLFLIVGIAIGLLGIYGQLYRSSLPPEQRSGQLVYIADAGPYPWRVNGKPMDFAFRPFPEMTGLSGHVTKTDGTACRIEFDREGRMFKSEFAEVEVPCAKLSLAKPTAPRAQDRTSQYVMETSEPNCRGETDRAASLTAPVCE